MIRAKNCESVFKFVKVIPKTIVASFFLGHGVYADIRWGSLLRGDKGQ